MQRWLMRFPVPYVFLPALSILAGVEWYTSGIRLPCATADVWRIAPNGDLLPGTEVIHSTDDLLPDTAFLWKPHDCAICGREIWSVDEDQTRWGIPLMIGEPGPGRVVGRLLTGQSYYYVCPECHAQHREGFRVALQTAADAFITGARLKPEPAPVIEVWSESNDVILRIDPARFLVIDLGDGNSVSLNWGSGKLEVIGDPNRYTEAAWKLLMYAVPEAAAEIVAADPNSIRKLCESGAVCKVIGHRWRRWHDPYVFEMLGIDGEASISIDCRWMDRECSICGRVEHRKLTEWQEH